MLPSVIHFLPIENKKTWAPSYLVILIETILFLLYFKTQNLYLVAALILFFILFCWIFFSLTNTFILLFTIISILPSESWGIRYPFFHGIYFKIQYIYIFTAFILLWIAFNKPFRVDFKQKSSGLDLVLFFFLSFSVLAAFRGGIEGEFAYLELTFLLLYAFYFIFKYQLTYRQLTILWRAFMGISIFVSIEYILLAYSEVSNSDLMVFRVVTRQPHLAQFAFPFFFTYFLTPHSKRIRLLAGLSIVCILSMVFLSQQRGLWVGIVATLLTLLASYYFIGKKITLMRIIKFIGILFVFIVILFGVLFLLDKLFLGSVLLTLVDRIDSILNYSMDISMKVRFSEISRAMDQWSHDPFTMLFGTGLGAKIHSIDPSRQNTTSVDNSYILFLWKMGIIGLSFFIMTMLLMVKKVFIGMKKATVQEKQILLSIFSGFIGLFFIAITNACLYRYRFIIVWAFALALIDVISLRNQSS